MSLYCYPTSISQVPTKTEAFIISRDQIFYSLLTEVRVFCCEACHKCFHLAIIFKFVAAKTLLQWWTQLKIAPRRITLI